MPTYSKVVGPIPIIEGLLERMKRDQLERISEMTTLEPEGQTYSKWQIILSGVSSDGTAPDVSLQEIKSCSDSAAQPPVHLKVTKRAPSREAVQSESNPTQRSKLPTIRSGDDSDIQRSRVSSISSWTDSFIYDRLAFHYGRTIADCIAKSMGLKL